MKGTGCQGATDAAAPTPSPQGQQHPHRGLESEQGAADKAHRLGMGDKLRCVPSSSPSTHTHQGPSCLPISLSHRAETSQGSCFQSGVLLLPRDYVAMSGDIFHCYK